MICLKIDAATRLDRSMLGLNIQFIKHGKIMLRTLGIKELKERHTAEYLKEIILKTLKEYEINYTQIYSITTDNGANMIKTVNLLQQSDEMAENNEQEPEDIDSNEEVTVKEYNNFIEIENVANDLLTSFNTNIISLVRCWAHTLQLCVDDALKDRNQVIAKARKAAKKLRTPTILVLIKKMKLRKPIVDCPTRWHSTCDMLERLSILQEFCKDMAPSHNELHLKEGEWTQINNIVSALLPAKIATKKLQSEQLTIGDCYSSWVTCQLETSKINNIISDLVVNSMKKRESKLLENGAFLAGVFLDARYHVLLKEEQRLKAQLHLKEIWETIKMLNESEKYNEIENSSTDSSELETDELEILLKSKENKVIKNSSNNETGSDIAEKESEEIPTIASISDLATNNRCAVRRLSKDYANKGGGDYVYNIDGNKIYHLFDAPHLRHITYDGKRG
ncbi:hypothetical protein CBL_20772 [Carabus blaptoides fortunei]